MKSGNLKDAESSYYLKYTFANFVFRADGGSMLYTLYKEQEKNTKTSLQSSCHKYLLFFFLLDIVFNIFPCDDLLIASLTFSSRDVVEVFFKFAQNFKRFYAYTSKQFVWSKTILIANKAYWSLWQIENWIQPLLDLLSDVSQYYVCTHGSSIIPPTL